MPQLSTNIIFGGIGFVFLSGFCIGWGIRSFLTARQERKKAQAIPRTKQFIKQVERTREISHRGGLRVINGGKGR